MYDEIGRREFMAAAAAAVVAGVGAPFLSQVGGLDSPLPPVSGTLRERANRKGLLCGTAVAAPDLAKDALLRKALTVDANVLVSENELKWSRIQRNPDGSFDFTEAEKIYDFAVANGMAMRGHNLAWWEAKPAWAVERVAGMSASQTGDFLSKYITDVVGHWRGKLIQWDVVNEPIGAKDLILDKMFGPKLGEQYIDLAFEATAAADPSALRVLNQDLIAQDWWYQERQRDSTLRLLERMMKRGAKIQCLGFEAHLTTSLGLSETKWRHFLDEVTGMGLKLMVTELDVDDRGTLGSVATRDEQCAALAKGLLDIMLSYPACLGVLTWGPVDRYSWLRKMANRQRKDNAPLRPTPRDNNYQPKPLWRAIASALDQAAPRPAL
ncbi:MAG: endo-1,4-beta-xylanase [Sphingomonas bacterium]